MQAAWGCEGAAGRLNSFFSEMDKIVTADPFAAPADPDKPSTVDIAMFEAIAARAKRRRRHSRRK
jgi:hypothetical protein